MSPCTNRLQRSTRSLAPFSGLNASVCACTAGANTAALVPSVAAAAPPAEPSRNLRRLNEFIVCLLDQSGVNGRGKSAIGCSASGRQTPAGAGIEQVGALRVGQQVHGAAGGEVVALAEHGREFHAVVPADHEGVHA